MPLMMRLLRVTQQPPRPVNGTTIDELEFSTRSRHYVNAETEVGVLALATRALAIDQALDLVELRPNGIEQPVRYWLDSDRVEGAQGYPQDHR